MQGEKGLALIDGLLKETALLVGGLAAADCANTVFVEGLMEGLEIIRHRAIRRLGENDLDGRKADLSRSGAEPHPAIEEFLMSLERA